MNSSISHPAQKSAALPVSSNRKSFSLNWFLVITGAIANGLILFYPMYSSRSSAQSTAQTVLPPVSATARQHYSSQIKQSSKLLQSSHTQQDHFELANALANLGCRDAATEQYGIAMSHEAIAHSHSPVNACTPQTLN